MPTVESLGTNYNSDTKERSRSRSNDKVIDNNDSSNKKKRNDEELPLSFASFYYSLKVLKGKGMNKMTILINIFFLFNNFKSNNKYQKIKIDEREDVQKKTFAKWINSQLIKVRKITCYNNNKKKKFNNSFLIL